MSRINEAEAADRFVENLLSGRIRRERSVNSEVDYHEKKEADDTEAVREFAGSDLFKSFAAMV